MRIAVVDDERPARSELKYLVEQCEPEAEIAEADGSEEFLAMLENETFDVCFVDINLGGMNGTTLASMIKRKQPLCLISFRRSPASFLYHTLSHLSTLYRVDSLLF